MTILLGICIGLSIILSMALIIAVRSYGGTHAKLENEREEKDKFQRLFKFMGKWIEAEENGIAIADKISSRAKASEKNIVILGTNPIAQALTGKLARAGLVYRNEENVDNCTEEDLVIIADISNFEIIQKKLTVKGFECASIEDIFYGD